MQDYRLYVLDDAGTLQFPQEFRAADDRAAIAIADGHCGQGRQMELWALKRKVHSWGFPDRSSSSERPAAN